MISRKIIIITVASSLLLGTFTPMLEAAESNKINVEVNNTNINDKLPKEVHSYDEFINANEPVVIDPNLLTVSQLRQQGVSERNIREIHQSKLEFEDRAPQYGKIYGKKKWSQSFSKNQIAYVSAGFGNSLLALHKLIKYPVVGASGYVLNAVAGFTKASKYKGLKIGGVAHKKLYRKNFYTTPKLTWVYYANWAKRY